MLGEWAPMEAQAPAMDFAERLSLWLNAFDAIGLQAAHQSIRSITAAAPGRPADRGPALAQALERDVEQVRGALASAIAQAVVPRGPAEPAAAPDGYAAYQQRHQELQRRMEQMIGPLREQVRRALRAVSPRLRQLATLDAVYEHLLGPREQRVLPAIGALLERRFQQLRLAHGQEAEAAGPPQQAPARQQAGGWRAAFEADWRGALRAELDLRLEPVVGLIEALGNEMKHRP